MTRLIDVTVPDIGDYKDVPVIELLVKAGDTLNADDPIVTLESDKATMDVPAPEAGTVREVLVKVGDRVSQGSLVLKMEAAGAGAAPVAAPAETPPVAAPPSAPPTSPTISPSGVLAKVNSSSASAISVRGAWRAGATVRGRAR